MPSGHRHHQLLCNGASSKSLSKWPITQGLTGFMILDSRMVPAVILRLFLV